MPYKIKWVKAEVAFLIRMPSCMIEIYHTYKNNDFDDIKLFYQYAFDEDGKYAFDVRDLPPFPPHSIRNIEGIKATIKNAMEINVLYHDADFIYHVKERM